MSGISNKWNETLEDQKSLKTIASNLNKLKEAIESKDTEKTASLLSTLGEQTTKAADDADGSEATNIKHLSNALKTASKVIAKLV